MASMRSTDTNVETLRWVERDAEPSGEVAWQDALLPGLVLRLRQSGSKSWSVRYRIATKPYAGPSQRVTLGSYPAIGLKEAREQARRILTAAQMGEDPRQAQRERDSYTLASVAQRFVIDLKRHISSWRPVETTLRLHVIPLLGDRPLAAITKREIHAVLDALVAKGKAGAAREVRKNMSRLYTFATNRDFCHANPLEGLQRRDLPANKDAGRALRDDELRAIWRAGGELGYPFGDAIRLLLLTGQRRSDIFSAQHSELDGDRRLLEVPRNRYKSRRDHIVPLAPASWAIVEQLPKAGYLFTTTGTTSVSGFSRAKTQIDDAAGVSDWRLHDLRVTAETRLAALGVDRETRDAVLGHAKLGLQQTYNKFDYLKPKQEALQAYAHHVGSVVA
jgi:integrase